ncbi:hypothetical protein JTE90_025732 [Oedothorax gibbosus]|uniref:ENPP1-3/EXOG-like endonuclease/phosphodiesterase domain-containing protein n=1 Tax=Oedothorax gibbosus TaxID=931172 RepID=A0AAV6UUG1_9ARAC|nr:hypothetical protein JTE90_025732 [Oedothorax gibbosus]
MELIQRYQIPGDASNGSAFGNLSSRFPPKKIAIMVISGLAIALVVFVGGYFAGVNTYRQTNDQIADVNAASVFPASPRRALQPIKWSGVCPQKASKCPQSFIDSTPLILISLDGLRPDYLKRGFTPTLSKLSQCGTNADFMYPVFPSKTFPNHYSIVTGLNPPSHGITGNIIYEPVRRKMFKIGSPDMNQPYWYQKDPIWVTAIHQGKKTACFFWPGSEVKINNTSPTYFKKYSSRLNYDMRVDQVLEWLDLPVASRPNFITLYANEPDHAAHATGTKSQQVNQALSSVDNMIARLYSGLQARNLVDCVNVIILSDHGMTDTNCKNVVHIENYMNVSQVFATVGPFGRLRPKGKTTAAAVEGVISKLKCQSPNMRVYAKEQLPVRMHYADNNRIEPIFLDLDNGWTVVYKGAKDGDGICSGASHGYDNLFPDMKAMFIAQGLSFKRNFTTKPFINTELYEMMSELIGITPNPNNGTRGSLHHILKNPKSVPQQIEPDPAATGAVPSDELEYNYRVIAANCSCSQTKKQSNEDIDKTEKTRQHLPFGMPYSSADNRTLRLLYNEDYVNAFDLKYRIPSWSSFTISKKGEASKVEDLCWTGDARVPINDAANCGDYVKPAAIKNYIFQRPLFPPSFSDPSLKDQATYVTNSIPKSMNHSKILEKKLNDILGKWAEENGQVNVIMGPAFDIHATGIKPELSTIVRRSNSFDRLAVSTHIFVITTWCTINSDKINDCNPSQLESQGFLLPNLPYPQNCEPAASVIQRNVARVVDIEKLTGYSFYTGLPIYDAIRLRTRVPSRSVS